MVGCYTLLDFSLPGNFLQGMLNSLMEMASEHSFRSGKRGDYHNCSVLYRVLKLCTVVSTLRWAVLTVLWIGFCQTGPISLCIGLFVFICVYFVCFCFILHSCCIIVSMGERPDGIEAWSLGPIFPQCFDAVGWVIWPVKTHLQYDL